GIQAIELAGTLRQMQLDVDIVCDAPHPWAPIVGENVGGLIARVLSSKGIKTHVHAHPTRLEGDGRVQRVLLDNGEVITTDLVVGAIGIAPNKQILRATPIRSETAILADAHGRTNVPEIFAAGECAAIFDPLFDKHRLLQHEHSALATGRLAGRNMAGIEEAYSDVSSFGSIIFNLELAVWGAARLVHHRIVRGSAHEDVPSLLELGVSDKGRVVQVVAAGNAIDRELLPELIRNRVKLDGNEELAKDPAFDLRGLLG
ncbi:MAG TPA: FAD-dependent oxidoreductase, partial [Tepidisphaeraceae bacterium]|nr:FAD-dependent oxidoreductase [Tepidisphaeraceae bacterium]